MKGVKKVFDAFDGGYEIVADLPRITILGIEKAYIENFISLEEYQKENIKLKCKNCVIELIGENFCIKTIREACIEVQGKIENVNYI